MTEQALLKTFTAGLLLVAFAGGASSAQASTLPIVGSLSSAPQTAADWSAESGGAAVAGLTQPLAVSSASVITEPIVSDTRWTPAGSPYLLRTSVEVRRTATLTMEPGTVVLLADSGSLRLFGDLLINGTAADPVLVRGLGDYPALEPFLVSAWSDGDSGFAEPTVRVRHLVAENVWNTVSLGFGAIEISNSQFVGPATISYTSPYSAVTRYEGTTPVLDHIQMTNTSPFSMLGRGTVRDSRLEARSDAEVWMSASPDVSVANSTLHAPGGQFVCACVGYPRDVDMRGNYWHAATAEAIERLIVDNNDSDHFLGQVLFDGWLSQAPTASMFPPAMMAAPSVEQSATGSVSIRWSPPVSDGGSPVSQYLVRSWPDGSTHVVPGDQTKMTLPLEIVPNGYAVQVAAVNAIGTSPFSWASNRSGPTADVPQPPGDVQATPGNGSARVSWSPPASNGGSPILTYTVQAKPGGKITAVSGDRRSVRVTGLTNGTRYSFTVQAANSVGQSAASLASPVITPSRVPTPPRIGRAKPGAHGGKATATATWRPPLSDGGVPISAYRVVAYRYRANGTVASQRVSRALPASRRTLTMVVPDPGKYRFRVKARNASGWSRLSARSSLVSAR